MNYFDVLFVKGGAIGWLLWGLSLVTVAIIVEYFIAIRRSNLFPAPAYEQIKGFFANKQYREAIEHASRDESFFGFVFHASMIEAPHGYLAMERALEEAAEQRTIKLLRHVEWLNLIGNISPMMGLLGTVWGMINAFFKIVEARGIPDPSELAGSIGIALVTTLLGLGIAIPALAIYAIMRNRIDAISNDVMLACQELISSLRPKKAPAQEQSETNTEK